MRYDISGPAVESDVTHERIGFYGTTLYSCQCPANLYRAGRCKHIAEANHGCGCPETLWMAHPVKGRVVICAEIKCEYGRIRRQALLNDGWDEVPLRAAPRMLCWVCQYEVLPNVGADDMPALRVCYKGEHWIIAVCAECGAEAIRENDDGAAVCLRHFDKEEMPIAV